MRKLLFILVIGLLVGFTACQEGKVSKKNIQLDSLTEDTIEEDDSTLYGFCGEGTSMNSLELISDEGDTLQLSLADDTIPNVKGGLQVGDRMALRCQKQVWVGLVGDKPHHAAGQMVGT